MREYCEHDITKGTCIKCFHSLRAELEKVKAENEKLKRVADAARVPGCYCVGVHEECSLAYALAALDAEGSG